jgi:cell division protein FtsZ
MVKEGLINLDFADVRAVMREMGKAMMGTGEAEGDKRALSAAEAAISNPLIDDASMKGAKGLLISITGGRDLKLYEVDEAATRIREEVDQDANIIVGATFDESLDGIIRVSVVATGIDRGNLKPAPLPQSEKQIADIVQGLRAEKPRAPDQAAQAEPAPPVRPAAAAPAAPSAPPASVNASIASVAKAAIAAAIMPQGGSGDDVQIRPLAPKPSLFIDPAAAEPEKREPEAFIPPAPERPVSRAPRMPRIDELPIPAQNEIRARRGELVHEDHPEKQRLTLLQRLGLGRRDPDEEPAAEANHRVSPASAPAHERLAGRPMPRAPEPRPEPVSEYAKRPAPQGLDQHGRQTAVHNSQNANQEDQLDIPAFLRRQAN